MQKIITGTLPVPPYSETSWIHGDTLYAIFNKQDELVYIGITRELRNRLKQHYGRSQRENLGYSHFIAQEQTRGKKYARSFEHQLIYELQPRDNKSGKEALIAQGWALR